MGKLIKLIQPAFYGGNGRAGYLWYVIKFISAFLLLYFGTLLIIGLTSVDNFYSSFVANYLDYISPLRQSLLIATSFLMHILGYSPHFTDKYTLGVIGGGGVRMVYSCLGYGVMSFWGAFVIANRGSKVTKLQWILLGWLVLWLLNVLRLSFILIAGFQHWGMPFGLDHHTLFNIVAYSFIFMLMCIYDRNIKLTGSNAGTI